MLSSSSSESTSYRPQSHIISEKLGTNLVRSRKISLSQLQRALARPSEIDRPGWHLVAAKLITESEWAHAIAELFNLAAARLDDFTIDRELVRKVPEELARRYQLLPLVDAGGEIYVAVTDPTELNALDQLRAIFSMPIQPLVVPPTELEEALRRYYLDHDVSDIEHVEADALRELSEAELAQLKMAGEDGQIVELVDRMLAHAISIGASDIHIEPFAESLQVRFRVDGLLREGASYPRVIAPWVASRIKVLARLDIAERFVPQDGRVRTRKRGREIDLRISCLPVAHGEKVVIRLLGHGTIAKPLEELGFRPEDLEVIRRQMAKPYGMMLVTGPTGSGKSTTLYATLRERANPEINVVTVEDPIEYEIAGLNQVPVNPKRGVTFARALRAILRQDPDVILVGEIRDRETGVTAAEAAVTGHLLLSTLHTNDAASAIHRLLEMGVPAHLVAPSVNVVVAQRLMRKVCRHCAAPYPVSPGELRDLLPGLHAHDLTLMRADGCLECDETGYRGRVPIHEVLVIDEDLRLAISKGASTAEINTMAVAAGMRDLRTAALERVFAGETTLDELYRVVLT